MTEIYGNKWTSSYGESDVRGTWGKGLFDMSEDDLKKGFGACMANGEKWPPALPEFRKMCRPTPEPRTNHAAYIVPDPSTLIEKKLSDEDRQTGREKLAALKSSLMK